MDVQQGRIIGLFGMKGSGKTTLTRYIIRLYNELLGIRAVIYEMTTIRSMITQRRRPERLGFEIGIAYPYYEQIILSKYLTSKKNPNSKMVLAACKEYDKYLDNILPLRRILKKVD